MKEPRGKLETFEVILQDYYKTVNGKLNNAPQKKSSRTDVKKNAKVQKTESFSNMKCEPKNGAALLAVCRGKVTMYRFGLRMLFETKNLF